MTKNDYLKYGFFGMVSEYNLRNPLFDENYQPRKVISALEEKLKQEGWHFQTNVDNHSLLFTGGKGYEKSQQLVSDEKIREFYLSQGFSDVLVLTEAHYRDGKLDPNPDKKAIYVKGKKNTGTKNTASAKF